MKKIIALLLVCVSMLLCACGQTGGAQETTGEPSGQTTGSIQAGQETGDTAAADPKALAQSCEGGSVEALYALIGQPQSSEYAPSCLNPGQGEDGMLYYDGFVVYTYREGDTETVEYVE